MQQHRHDPSQDDPSQHDQPDSSASGCVADGGAGNEDYGVGVDSEVIDRWRRRLPSLRRSARLFTEREHAYCERFADPAPVYAGSWCAKEAVFKAVSRFGTLTLDQIEIERLPSGCPCVHLPRTLAALVRVRVSITHDTERAVAFAVAVAIAYAGPIRMEAANAGCEALG